MPRLRIRDFSGGLVTNQSEFDISESQYTAFTNVSNKKPGRLEKFNSEATISAASSGSDVQTEFLLYRTEKNAADADTSTTWWVYGNGTVLKRQDTSTGTGGSWADITSGWSSSPIYDFLVHNQALRISDGSFSNDTKWYGHIKRDIFGQNIALGDAASDTSTQVPRFATVYHNQTLNDWYVQNAAIPAPTIVAMHMAHDGYLELSGGVIDSDNATVTVSSTLNLTPGMKVFNNAGDSGIPTDAYIVSITTDTRFEMSANATGSGSGRTIKFSALKENNDVGIFVYEPRHKYDDNDTENDEHNAWVNAIDNETFDPADRWAVTYLYDYVQESSLSLNRDGEIGVTGFEVEKGSSEESDSTGTIAEDLTLTEGDINVSDGALFTAYTYIKVDQEIMFITAISSNTLYVRRGQLNTQAQEHISSASISYRSSPQKGRAINLVLNGLAAAGYHNPRITGLNIYWQPKDDVDWYLVETLDINKGYSESILGNVPDTLVPGSSNLAPFYASNSYNSYALKNYGYWIPCPNPVAADDVTKASDGSGAQFTADTDDWTGANNDFDNSTSGGVAIAILSRKESNDSTNLRTQFNRLGAYHTPFTSITTTNSKLKFRANNNVNRVHAQHTATYANVVKQNRITTHTALQDKATTWYIPFDGLKLATYNSLTGRAAKTKLNSIKWNTSAVVNHRAYYADIDTVDENEQTAREKNRIYFTDQFKLDEILPGRYFDVGRNDGDEIVKLISYRDRLFVFKGKNTYVYNQRHQLERTYIGVGAIHKHAVTETPLGLVCANKQAVVAVTPTSVRDLSFNIKDTYQGLTFEQTALGYDGIQNELFVMNDADANNVYVMNLDNGSWVKRAIGAADIRSNYVQGGSLRPQYLEVRSSVATVNRVNTGSASTSSLLILTKRFDFEAPDVQKRFRKITMVYKSGTALTVNLYVDDGYTTGTVAETVTMGTHSNILSASNAIRAVGKTLQVSIASTSSDIELDSIDIDYDLLGSNP